MYENQISLVDVVTRLRTNMRGVRVPVGATKFIFSKISRGPAQLCIQGVQRYLPVGKVAGA